MDYNNPYHNPASHTPTPREHHSNSFRGSGAILSYPAAHLPSSSQAMMVQAVFTSPSWAGGAVPAAPQRLPLVRVVVAALHHRSGTSGSGAHHHHYTAFQPLPPCAISRRPYRRASQPSRSCSRWSSTTSRTSLPPASTTTTSKLSPSFSPVEAPPCARAGQQRQRLEPNTRSPWDLILNTLNGLCCPSLSTSSPSQMHMPLGQPSKPP